MTTLSQLAAEYNEIAATLGQPTVRRFSNRQAAERRLAQLKTLVPPVTAEPEPVAEPAPVAAEPVAEPAPVAAEPDITTRGNGDGLRPLKWYTEQYNALVPEAVALGINARHHTSLFESRVKGEKQLAWLEAAISEAKK